MKTDASAAALTDADELGFEARSGSNDHMALKLWLRMLSSTTQVENEVRRRLRVQFDTSLSRFDYLAQLYRSPDGLRMKDLSSYLMVTGANVTALTDELERDALVLRSASPTDRRSWIVSLTDKGRIAFEEMAREHEKWLWEFFSVLNASTLAQMYQQLGNLRVHMLQCQLTPLSPPNSIPS